MKKTPLFSTLAVLATLLVSPLWADTSGDDDTLSVRAAAAKHATYRLDTWSQLVHKWRMLGKSGMRLKDIEVLQYDNGKRVYGGVWEPGSGKHALFRYSSWSAFVNKWRDLNPRGYRLVDVERVRHGNTIWYYGIWRAGSGKFALYNYRSWSAFTAKWADLNSRGYRLIDIDISQHNGVTSYVGVWRGGGGQYALFNFSSWASLADKWSELGPQGYQMIDMDVTRLANGTYRYVGVWRGGSNRRALYRYTTWTAFKRKWAQLAERGYSLLDLEVAQRNTSGAWYVGSFGPAPSDPASGPDLQAMAQFLEDTLDENSVVGMSYALSQHGQLAIAGSTGFAQRNPDAEVPMTSKIRSTVASVSKAVTAPLIYKLLAANGLDIDSPIASWLPAGWVKGPGFVNNANGLTFRHLLTHTSGLNQEFNALKDAGLEGPWGNGWDGLEFVVENGTVPDSPRQYKNANFALLRILIPELWKAAGGPGTAVTKANVGERYLSYLHELVMDREDIESVVCWPQTGYPEAKGYNFDDMSLAGYSSSSSLDGCGGHANLHLSAQELTQYAAAFRFDDGIMSPGDRSTMRTARAGWNGAGAVDGGTAYDHGGAWNHSGGRRTRTCMMELPNGVNASIIINSQPAVGSCSALRQAFNAATAD
ncbi:MAG: beta-lactamase family protein [Deltaproteobacteria bacterium]|nr:beta-lactamase family protein [Deltaproteobacteria bacterium]